MTTPERPPAVGADPDPTGIRDLLGSLPDPGPMPADVADRILVSLATEQAHRSIEPEQAPATTTTTPASPALAPQPAPVDLAAFRDAKSRRRQPALIAAATALALTGIGLVATSAGQALIVTSESGQTMSETSADSAAGSSQIPSLSPNTSSKVTPSVASPARSHLTASGQDWTTDLLVAQASSLLIGQFTNSSPGQGAASPLAADIGEACATALGLEHERGLAVDVGVNDNQPVIALVGRSADGTVRTAMARICESPTPVVVQGPRIVP